MSECNEKIAGLIGSRICHDLASPLGAVANGLELLDLTGEVQGPEMALIRQSLTGADAKLRFLRVAFGRGAAGPAQTADTVTRLTDDYFSTSRISVRWQVETVIDPTVLRCLFGAILCMETALPLGGEITITRHEDRWNLSATGPRLSIEPDLWQALTGADGPNTDVTPAQVQFLALPLFARQSGQQIDWTATDDMISLWI